MTEELKKVFAIQSQLEHKLGRLLSYVENLDGVDPDDVTWADVGSMQSILVNVTELNDRVFQEGEYK